MTDISEQDLELIARGLAVASALRRDRPYAANYIEASAARLEELVQDVAAKDVRIAELEAALRPFAKGYWAKQDPKAGVYVVFNANPYDERKLCKVRDILRARAALKGNGNASHTR